MISFASPRSIPQVHPKLVEILTFLDMQLGSVIITSMYREGDRGVHGTLPVRGADIRCRDQVVASAIAGMINKRYQYDPDRTQFKCAIAHDTGLGLHVHLQVHENTEKL